MRFETPTGTPQQFPVRRPRPACCLHGADLVTSQLGGESTWQILVKQNAHGPEQNREPDRARQPPVASRPTETDRETGRGSLPLPDSRTSTEPAPACRGRRAPPPPRFPGHCGRPTVHRPYGHHTVIASVAAHAALARLRGPIPSGSAGPGLSRLLAPASRPQNPATRSMTQELCDGAQAIRAEGTAPFRHGAPTPKVACCAAMPHDGYRPDAPLLHAFL